MAVAMVGTPLALALGVPAGTLLGTLVGWRSIFGIMSLLALMLVGWVLWKLPDYPGRLLISSSLSTRFLLFRGTADTVCRSGMGAST